MGLLYASELTDSSEWVLKNAQDILDSVKQAGGWGKVFPKGVPDWLHRLRNYFNVEPHTLRLVDKSVRDHWMNNVRSHGKLSGFVGERTLTGHVYFDEAVEVWYQMGAGGTIYHWGRDVKHPKLEAAYTHAVRGQTGTPIFKFVCPDGTGGSKETIISNPYSRSTLGDTNQELLVVNRVITVDKYQGSYNFSETSVVGLKEHEKRDVNPHKKDPIYYDPPDPFEPLSKRIFNEFMIVAAGGTAPKKP